MLAKTRERNQNKLFSLSLREMNSQKVKEINTADGEFNDNGSLIGYIDSLHNSPDERADNGQQNQ